MFQVAAGSRAVAAALACIGTFHQPTALGQASAAPSKEEAVELPPVVVSATRSERPLEGLPVSASVINRRDLIESPSRTVDDAIRAAPGVQLPLDGTTSIFPLQPSIAMRGMGVGDTATRALVLVDGLPINGAFFGNVFWNRAPKQTIDRVEVVRGAGSSLYGSYALGGLVNIVTRPAGPKEGVVEGSYGEQNTLQGNLWYGQSVGSGAAVGFNANYYDSDGYNPFPSNQLEPVNQKISSRLYNLQGRADFTLSGGSTGFLRIGYNNQNWNGAYQLQNTKIEVPDVAGGVTLDLGNRTTLGIRGFYAHEDFRTQNVSVPDPTTSFVSNAHQTTSDDYGLSVVWSKGFDGVISRVTAGADYRYIDGQDNQDIYNVPGVLAANVLGGGKQGALGVFAEASVRPTVDTEILANLRYDDFRDTDGRIVTNGVAQTFPDRSFDVWSGRLAGRYQVIEPLALRASYYSGFRAPTLAERYRSFETPTFRGLSNPDLTRERVTGGDAGFDVHRGPFSAQFSWFYNVLKDFVASAEVGDVGGKFTVQNANIARILSRGVEAGVVHDLTKNWSVFLNYTYTNAKVTEGPFTGNMNEGSPENVFGAGVSYRDAAWNGALRARWLSHSYQDISNTALQPANTVVDFFGSYRVKRNVELFLVATNLFNEEYIGDGFGQTLGAPRQVSGGVRLFF